LITRRNLIGGGSLTFMLASSGRAGPDQGELKVHINQVALEVDGPKEAIVSYGGNATGGRFNALRDGTIAFTGDLAPLPDLPEWDADRRFFRADFSALNTPGTYQIEVKTGATGALSAPVVVGRDAMFALTAEALVTYFRLSRHTDDQDRHIRVYDTDRHVDVWGGWKDAGGDNGKYLSHLSYANFFNPQQAGFAAWSLARSYSASPDRFRAAGLERAVLEEAMWGADYLHRLLSPEGYFYMTVFDRWAAPGAERVVTGYAGAEGVYTTDYQAAFREGAGVAIAALAHIARLSRRSGVTGAFAADQYLADARRGFAHLQASNPHYVDDGHENIIDDYTALLAAVELYASTGENAFLDAARQRAASISNRVTPEGWFRSDDDDRPFYHAVEAGFPILSLAAYLRTERDESLAAQAKDTIGRVLDAQLALDQSVANPFDYPRQTFRLFKDGRRGLRIMTGFFMPHANETGYWWQGESARLASLAVAALLGGRAASRNATGAFGVVRELAAFAQHQLDWTLGRNPYDMCMLYGLGMNNPPHAKSAGVMVRGGISNGITGAPENEEGRGIAFAPGPDSNNWRWIEQWLPHSSWMLLLVTALDRNAGA
jgi:Glycosyl hydrolase family 9/Cellulase N-terminal ig-like domain